MGADAGEIVAAETAVAKTVAEETTASEAAVGEIVSEETGRSLVHCVYRCSEVRRYVSQPYFAAVCWRPAAAAAASSSSSFVVF